MPAFNTLAYVVVLSARNHLPNHFVITPKAIEEWLKNNIHLSDYSIDGTFRRLKFFKRDDLNLFRLIFEKDYEIIIRKELIPGDYQVI